MTPKKSSYVLNPKPEDGCQFAGVVQVILVKCKRGTGLAGDPVRLVNQFWTMDGALIGENDPANAPEEKTPGILPFSLN